MVENRRVGRFKRRSSRNASSDTGGNEQRKKPTVNQDDDLGPKKPKLKPDGVETPKPPAISDPSKIGGSAMPKPSFVDPGRPKKDVLKLLDEFNKTIDAMAHTGAKMAEAAGGLSALEKLRAFNEAMNIDAVLDEKKEEDEK